MTSNPNPNAGDISRLIKEAWERGEPAGWFEAVYARAEAGQGMIPWAMMQPNPRLVAWLDAQPNLGAGHRALVIGCGLGDDAEALAERGFAVTAFDISETAVRQCRTRFPNSKVDYVVADLFKTPEDWRGAFDFVFESRTVQSLPFTLAEAAIAQIAAFVAPEGTLLVLCAGREPEEDRRGIPWPLSRAELQGFLDNGLREVGFEEFTERGGWQFQVAYMRLER
jgi:SAM-dependent methyltransferase